MGDTRAKFRELTRVFDTLYRPHADGGGGPGSSYVPEAHEGFRAQLEVLLDMGDSAKLLVAGQPGCGKTTLLLSVAQKLKREGRLVAFVNLEEHTSVRDLGPVEMHLAAAAELLLEAKAMGVQIPPATLATSAAWLRPTLGESLETEPEVIARALRRLLASGRESTTLRDELRRIVKEGASADPAELLTTILESLLDLRPVVILDGLDKLSPETARVTFLDDKKGPMIGAPGAAILTVPLTIVYEAEFSRLAERYLNADAAVLPAVRLWNLESRKLVRSEPGMDLLRKIVNARIDPIDPRILMPDAVDRAIEGSGGNLREMARLIQASLVKTLLRKGDVVERQDIEAALADRRETFRRGYDARFYPILKKVDEEHVLDDTSNLSKTLLYALWVTEYRNGNAWYILPEPVAQLLQHIERRKQ